MDALELLLNRRSHKKLTHPAPQGEQLDNILQAAMHAPDHGRLKPYKFIVIEGAGLETLGELFKETVVEFDLGDEKLQKAEELSQRAPMIIAVIAKLDSSIAKVPTWEQMLAAGTATYAMQLAANAQGFDNVWITGNWVKGGALRDAFNCEEDDQVIALLMLGTAEGQKATAQVVDYRDYVDYL